MQRSFRKCKKIIIRKSSLNAQEAYVNEWNLGLPTQGVLGHIKTVTDSGQGKAQNISLDFHMGVMGVILIVKASLFIGWGGGGNNF